MKKYVICKTQNVATSIALILLIAVSGIMIAMPISKAQTVTLPTNAFLSSSPNPAGIGQQVTIEMWLAQANPTASGLQGSRWENFNLLITKPDGTTQKLGPFIANDASFAVTTYTPEQIGNYTVLFTFPGQQVTGLSAVFEAPVDSYYGASNSTTILTVQQQSATTTPQSPLPTSYWTRPINSQNSFWSQISGNWLALGLPNSGSTNGPYYNASGNFNPYTSGPNSAHILWTKPVMDGGLIGGEFGGTATSNYYTGKTYEDAFNPPIIMNGILYYNSPTPPREGFYAVDLRTGQTLWWQNSTGSPMFTASLPGFFQYAGINLGQVYNYQSLNQEGGIPYLWWTGSSTWNMYDANTGNLILQISNGITGGNFAEGPSGELLDYIIGNNWLALWNSSLCIGSLATYLSSIPGYPPTLSSTDSQMWRPPIGRTLNWNQGVQWNVTVQTYGAAIDTINSGVILASTGLPFAAATYQTDVGYSATTGQQLWVQNRTYPSGPSNNFDYSVGPMSNGIYTEYDAYGEQWYGFSALTGDKLWGPTKADTNPYGSVPAISGQSLAAYGILYGLAADGVHAFNLTTGAELWNFEGLPSGADVPGYDYYPFESISATVADGKIYVQTCVSHSDPLFRGMQLYCVNATTGALIWNVNGFYLGSMPIADGELLAFNGYDNQIYAYGMGPSKTTISAPQIGITTATPITITGSVTDISAGGSQAAVAANFPNGLPCVSDASMSQFMEAVYMQQPMPTNITGVPVTLSVLDSNGNYRSIGTTSTNAQGEYGFTWKPDISGNYTVYATFGGTQSYYGSSASTYFYASSAAPTAAPAATPLSGLASNTTVEYGIVAMAIIIIVIGAVLAVLVTRKHP